MCGSAFRLGKALEWITDGVNALTTRNWSSSVERVWSSETLRRRVLVVDDDSSLRSLLRILFATSGYDVTVAAHGEQALERIAERDFDIILLDLEMPVMNGRDFLRTYREQGGKTPVVIISAYGADTAQQELNAARGNQQALRPTQGHPISGRGPEDLTPCDTIAR
jgi:CheY-like chemotaxis protein